MKTLRLIVYVLIAGLAIGNQSCKKSDEGTGSSVDNDAAAQQQASDDLAYAQESEEAMGDADNAMAYSSYGKNGFKIDGAVIDSFSDKRLVITYNGNNANGSRHRSGKISIQLTSGDHWRDQNAVLTITFTNYTVIRNSTGKRITLNGTYTITNMSGGLIIFMPLGDSVYHRIAGNIDVSFDNGQKQYNWKISRDRVIGRANGGSYYVSISGYGNEDGQSNVAVKGTNRNGRSFITIITSPVVFSSSCGWNATSGNVIYKGAGGEMSVMYGVDADGNPETSGCPYGFKLSWTNSSGQAKVAVIKY